MISILLILSLSVVFSASEDKRVDGICKPGWRRFENKCYRTFTEETDQIAEMDFQKAMAYCRERQPNSTLITIKSRKVQDFIKDELYQLNAKGSVLIGLKRPYRYSRHKWVDGTDLDYENWVKGEPNNNNGKEGCAQMQGPGVTLGQWNDIPCDVPKGFVCEAEPERVEGSCPNNTQLLGKMIDFGGSNCYFLNRGVAGTRDFDGARAECQELGGDLAVFETRRELEQLRPYLWDVDHPYFWVGISSRSSSNGDFRTLNEGKPVARDTWLDGEPNLLNIEKCAALSGHHARLFSFLCSYSLNFICQIAKVATEEESSKCSADQFKCDNGDCISSRNLCDNAADCGDRSDESPVICTENRACGEEEFLCGAYGRCIDESFLCDGSDDCGNGKDEEGCGFECPPAHFRCENNSACKPLDCRCDGEQDCEDNSDERYCGISTSTTTEMNDNNDENNGNEIVGDKVIDKDNIDDSN